MDILLSEKHGLNPSIPICYYCNKPKNEIILAGHLPGDAEAPQNVAWDKTPCDKCQQYMQMGVVCISIKDGETAKDNPYRTGGWVVIKAEAFERIFLARYNPPEHARDFVDDVLAKRVCWVEDKVWDALGLPRGAVPGIPSE